MKGTSQLSFVFQRLIGKATFKKTDIRKWLTYKLESNPTHLQCWIHDAQGLPKHSEKYGTILIEFFMRLVYVFSGFLVILKL